MSLFFSKWCKILPKSLHCTIIHIYSTPTDCQRTACSYLMNARIACIVCCRTSVVTKLSVPIHHRKLADTMIHLLSHPSSALAQRETAADWSSVCARSSESPRCSSFFPGSPFLLFDELDLLIFKTDFQFISLPSHKYFQKNWTCYQRYLFFWDWGFRISSPLLSREILGQIVIENEQWKIEIAQYGEFYF